MSNFEKIEAYTEGWMSQEERAAFESELQTNVELKRDYDDWLEADKILNRNLTNAENIEQLKNELAPLTQQYFKAEEKPKAKVVSLKNYFMAATAVAAALIIYFSMPGGIDNYNLPNMPQAVVRGSEELSNKGAQLFNDGKYAEALPILKERANAEPDDATANFFYALSLFELNRFKEALPELDKLIKGQSAYKEDAAFFAALAAYKLDRKEEAQHYAELVNPANTYYNLAQKIIKKLR